MKRKGECQFFCFFLIVGKRREKDLINSLSPLLEDIVVAFLVKDKKVSHSLSHIMSFTFCVNLYVPYSCFSFL